MINSGCVTMEQAEFVVNMTKGKKNKVDALDEALDVYRRAGEVEGYELAGSMAEELCRIINSSNEAEISDFINKCYELAGVLGDGQ